MERQRKEKGEDAESTREGKIPFKTRAPPEVYSENPDPLEKSAKQQRPNPRHIEALRRYRMAGYTYEKIAYFTGWSQATVYRHTKDIIVKDKGKKTADFPALTSTQNPPIASITSNISPIEGQTASQPRSQPPQSQRPGQAKLAEAVHTSTLPDGFAEKTEQVLRVKVDTDFLLGALSMAYSHGYTNLKDFWDRTVLPSINFTNKIGQWIPHKPKDYDGLYYTTVAVIQDGIEYREKVAGWKRQEMEKLLRGENLAS